MSKERFDIHQSITDKIVKAIEEGAGDFVMPWHRRKGGLRPVNVASGNAYQGINILALWVEAQATGYGSNVWGTYRQWVEKGAQVRKGAKAAHVVFYKQIELADEDADEDARTTRLFARATPVFNAGQVDGWNDPLPVAAPMVASSETLPTVETFVGATGADVRHGGDRAYYSPSSDHIQMPERVLFQGTVTSTATEAYYSTLCHELTHWTAAKGRCDRDLSGRFRSHSYAMEELVAELGAAFLCADLGISAAPRADHAQYLTSWLQVLKSDCRAVFTAAGAASKAVSYLRDRAGG
jgi:antirestriction protein ArdC